MPPGQAVVVMVREPELPAAFTVTAASAVTDPAALLAVSV
jgi:predicted dienelactone hydrolase